ncbi:MAG: alpha/beta hydrolase [Azoarcus sp.]|nr:alpha/beta hydrolase [Azoarcus sp.]
MATAAAPASTSLEVLDFPPTSSPAHPTPLLFVHGAYVGAWCWEEHFLPWFAKKGWSAHALSLSGHGHSRGRVDLDNLSISHYVADVAEVAASLPTPPVLIGHSMGGMVIQKYLEKATAPACVLMSSVPPQGLISSALGMLFATPHLLMDLNRIMGGGEPSLDSLREALFHQPISREKLQHYWRLSQPESHRALWDMTFYDLPRPSRVFRPPMLVLGAEYDRLISPSQVQMTAQTYNVKAEIFPRMGHGLMLERDWEKVATRIDQWLSSRNL